jgi:hypothetical protein
MRDPALPSISELLANDTLINAAINRAIREAVLRHAKLGQPVSTWRDGKVVWLQPAEIFALFQEPEKENGEPGA